HPKSAVSLEFDAWIDTGFTGELVLPRIRIDQLGLPLGPKVTAVLADGSQIELDTYTCNLNWFGTWKKIQVVANEGQFPLLGVGLLQQRELRVDYRTGTLSVD